MEAVLSHEGFAQHINTKFQVKIDDQRAVELELTEVSDLKLYPKQEEFAVTFLGPLDMFLGQGLRSFAHEQMGEFELFLVPIGQDERGYNYEAVFNRLREATT
jgi:hypothetical protein